MADQGKPGGMRLWLRVVFVISLALNLLIIGVVVGSVAKWGGPHHFSGARADHMGGPLTRALSDRDRHRIGREMRRAFARNPEWRDEKRAVFEALLADLAADPFDREKIAGHFARQKELTGARIELGQALLLDRLQEMSAAERAAFVERLKDRADRYMRR